MATFSDPTSTTTGADVPRDRSDSLGSSFEWSDVDGDEYLRKALAADDYLRGSTNGGMPAEVDATRVSRSSTGDSKARGHEADRGMIVVHHPACELHEIPDHPERPGRVRAIMNALMRSFPDICALQAPKVKIEQILRFHSRPYVDEILSFCSESERRFRVAEAEAKAKADASTRTARDGGRRRGGPGVSRRRGKLWQTDIIAIDPDTAVMSGSREAILRAAGAACLAVDEVMSGRARNAFCCVRPPGHHAEPDAAMGFCFFNNAPIGALHAQAEHGVERVAVVDIDVHHGNGTQAAFAKNPSTFYASTHQGPNFYPCTGFDDEEGVTSNVVNVNMKAGEGSQGFRKAYSEKILTALEAFQPGLIVISAGFDAHKDDPLAGIALKEDDYGWVTREICAVASRVCDGRVVSILEGGYNLRAISDSAVEHVRALREAAVAGAAASQPLLSSSLTKPWSLPSSGSNNGELREKAEDADSAALSTDLSSWNPLSGGEISNVARPPVKGSHDGGLERPSKGTVGNSSAKSEESVDDEAVAFTDEHVLSEAFSRQFSSAGVTLSEEQPLESDDNLPGTRGDCARNGHSDGVTKTGCVGAHALDLKEIEECGALMAQLSVGDGAN